MITFIILIYLILLCLYGFIKLKNNSNLVVYNNGQLIIQIIVIFFFILFYFVFLRFLNLFRINHIVDLHSVDININLILILIFLYKFRKLVMYLFKISWFKFHYVMMCETNFSSKINKNYKYIFYNIIYSPAYYSFKYLIYLNFVMSFVLYFLILYDLLFNSLVLDYSLYYLKYYSFFKLIYISYKFMAIRQNLILDYYCFNKMYPGDVSKSFFMNYYDDQHNNLIIESEKYSSGVILEKSEYLNKYLGNTAEMPYFKSIS